MQNTPITKKTPMPKTNPPGSAKQLHGFIDREMLHSALKNICTKYSVLYGKASKGLGLDLSLLPDTLSVPTDITKQHGYWISLYACKEDKLRGRAMDYECSECGKVVKDGIYSQGIDYEFCPYCGVIMDEKGTDDE